MSLEDEKLLSSCSVMIRCNDKQFNVSNRLRLIFQIVIFHPKTEHFLHWKFIESKGIAVAAWEDEHYRTYSLPGSGPMLAAHR
jgi:hypothetical protein